jgi:serpin B
MSYAGARGETASEMAKILHFTLPQAELPLGFHALLSTLSNEDFPGCRLLAANRLWCQKNLTFKEPFLTTLRDRYQSELGLVDFKQPEIARRTINAWVEEKTNRKIVELFGPGSINPKFRMALTSTIYFKGFWAHPFDKSSTRERLFYTSNKNIAIPMMNRKGYFNYTQNNEMQVLEKPYLGSILSMMIFLPNPPESMADLEKSLTAEKLQKISGAMRNREVEVYLPRFKLETNYDMIPSLRSLGINNAFNANTANFGGISDPPNSLWLASVIHHAWIRVDEDGTEAAGATGGGYFGGGPPPVVFSANHPFIFLIRDNRTGGILFLGRVMEPELDRTT